MTTWALIDPLGVVHATCHAHNYREAAYALKLTDLQAARGWVVASESEDTPLKPDPEDGAGPL